ncbi:hypothetical protein [Paenibacillus azoreducens]|uniref:Uncharacterized protein n=1 Tax=Paenibacillus azoreducens TaxID=116718 RepID=A0A920CTT9_9BACL|nr:hypothetical protein [Paenibacillus azoreducens]GIO49554.1 hypothetical protein J34TS1_43190 [Paenibacillus azoreducens]
MNRIILPAAAFLLALGLAPASWQPNGGLMSHSPSHTSVSRPKQVMPVVLHAAGKELNDENIVDELHSLPLTLTIRRVEWNQPSMSIDFIVPNPNTQRSEMYKNIAELLSFSFAGTSNVNQVKLRLIAEDPWLGTRHLLLAADAGREEWDMGLYFELRHVGEDSLPDVIKSRLHVIETNLWKTRFDASENG